MTTTLPATPAHWIEQLWQSVTEGDESAATDLVLRALDAGWEPESILLDLIAPVQGRVGEEWAANRFSVAQEHAATAINDRAIAALSHRTRTEPGEQPRRLAVACVDGEWHALPARLVAEVFRLRGWHVDYLGAQVPTHHLISHIHRTGPEAVALSGSIATHLPTAHAAVTAVQATGTPVLVGGAAFGDRGQYASLLGADLWAPDARTAAARLHQSPLPRPSAPHQPVDDLPHLSDQEYTLVSRTRPALVRTVMAGLAERFPPMRDYDRAQRDRTGEDIAHIVEFLATALYLDRADLFTGFLTWTARILDARGVPTHSLLPALALLRAELKDFPRTTHMIDRATDHLTGAGAVHVTDTRNPA